MPSLSKSNVISLFSSAISNGNSALCDSFLRKGYLQCYIWICPKSVFP